MAGVDLALEASVIEASKQLARVDEGGVHGMIAVIGANKFVAGHVMRLFQRGGWSIRGALLLQRSDGVRKTGDDRGRRYDARVNPDDGPGAIERRWTVELRKRFKDVRWFDPIDPSDGDNFTKIFMDCRFCVYCDDSVEDGFRRTPSRMLASLLKGMTNALRAAIKARVQRFVLISSACTLPRSDMISSGAEPLEPSEWAKDPRTVPERQSWRLYLKHKPEKKTVVATELISVNPSFIIGPPIDSNCSRSEGCDFTRGCIDGSFMQRGLKIRAAKDKLNECVGVADVRDVALVAFNCIENAEACGRYLVSSEKSYTRKELAEMLGECVDFEGFPIPIDTGAIAQAIKAASRISGDNRAVSPSGSPRPTSRESPRKAQGVTTGALSTCQPHFPSSSAASRRSKHQAHCVTALAPHPICSVLPPAVAHLARPRYDCTRTLELLGVGYKFRTPRKSIVDGANFLINKKLALKTKETVGPSGMRMVTVVLPPLFEAPTHVHDETGWYQPAMAESAPHMQVNGRFAFISDLVGRLPIASRTLMVGGVAAEATQAMRNLAVVVRAAGFPQRRWFIQELEVCLRTTRRTDHRHGPSHNDSFDPGGADDEVKVRVAIEAVCKRIVAIPPGSEGVLTPMPPMRVARHRFLPYGVAISINAVVQRWTKAKPKKDLDAGAIAALEAGGPGAAAAKTSTVRFAEEELAGVGDVARPALKDSAAAAPAVDATVGAAAEKRAEKRVAGSADGVIASSPAAAAMKAARHAALRDGHRLMREGK